MRCARCWCCSWSRTSPGTDDEEHAAGRPRHPNGEDWPRGVAELFARRQTARICLRSDWCSGGVGDTGRRRHARAGDERRRSHRAGDLVAEGRMARALTCARRRHEHTDLRRPARRLRPAPLDGWRQGNEQPWRLDGRRCADHDGIEPRESGDDRRLSRRSRQRHAHAASPATTGCRRWKTSAATATGRWSAACAVAATTICI